ncbi:hypothetical protein NPIL_415341 [Nephila pilipes]|uniref:Uncharacterized protein n=1 Tax=Nephila pilipes TaxID=299642 RepID=A0A8X6R228_NEPPI|nr:hypothetical protein NPIL_415341 [Nephila pilipes]
MAGIRRGMSRVIGTILRGQHRTRQTIFQRNSSCDHFLRELTNESEAPDWLEPDQLTAIDRVAKVPSESLGLVERTPTE